ncbi:MAG: hypothetical protein AVDCRST_MAG62-558 [uncultured Sphingomonas sp.]|uniref:Anti-sigma K factor RskA C-terminal domain-containing protein n=1 Tax=uncultured Sphingomonas sp. TaxID=158754 RepID=A0A6J4T2S5_9SPHN|nr:MAG: hypothetical protein AVDCRST_MAG62-558 [uncultured Sphingomonas sp.]
MTERELLAAEHALRLLEGEELLEARRLQAGDPAFAAEVATWEARLGPLFDQINPIEPGPELWERIERALNGDGQSARILKMRHKVRRWQAATGLATAAAIALALLAVPPLLRPPAAPPSPPTAPAPAPVLIASLGDESAPGAVAVTFVPAAGELLVTSSAIEEQADRDHELWIIPAGGSPISLGIVPAGESVKRRIAPTLRGQFRSGATIALSREPSGGSPTGQPTGPILATGSLQSV